MTFKIIINSNLLAFLSFGSETASVSDCGMLCIFFVQYFSLVILYLLLEARLEFSNVNLTLVNIPACANKKYSTFY